MAETAETRAYTKMKEAAGEDSAKREGLLYKVFGFFFSRSRRFYVRVRVHEGY
jgi:hypothetical protein